MEKQIALLVCLLSLGSIINASDADNDKIWRKLNGLEKENRELRQELDSAKSNLQDDIHELKAAQSQREICEY